MIRRFNGDAMGNAPRARSETARQKSEGGGGFILQSWDVITASPCVPRVHTQRNVEAPRERLNLAAISGHLSSSFHRYLRNRIHLTSNATLDKQQTSSPSLSLFLLKRFQEKTSPLFGITCNQLFCVMAAKCCTLYILPYMQHFIAGY